MSDLGPKVIRDLQRRYGFGTKRWYNVPCNVTSLDKTGIYQAGRAVPEVLCALVGKREEKVSLQTRDPRRPNNGSQKFGRA